MPAVIKDQILLNKINDVDFLKSIVDNITEGVVVFNDLSVVIAVNAAATQIFELSEDEILGTVLFEKGWTLLNENSSPFEVENLPSVITIKTGKPCDVIVLGVKNEKFLKWLKVKSALLQVSNSKNVIVTLADITQQLENNLELSSVNNQLHGLLKDLSNSENKFHNAFNYSGMGIALLSVTGQWLDVNPVICKMLGYSREEFLAMTFHDVTHPDDLLEDIILTKKLLLRKLIPTRWRSDIIIKMVRLFGGFSVFR